MPGRFWVSLVERLFGGDRDVPAQWRALKRLAIQGHDHEREQFFFPMEIRSARFVMDWPLHWKVWDSGAWGGVFRFWFGLAYQFASDFGRSVLRPLLLLTLTVVLFAALYVGESRTAGGAAPAYWQDAAAVARAAAPPVPEALAAHLPAISARAAYPCAAVKGRDLQPLEPELAAGTDAIAEALHLAVSNASVLGGIGGPDAARRTYGCLYGFVRDGGGNLAPIVPAAVSNWSLIQKTISLILLFLLGLAVRNMLKVR
ncbi:MAG: hypothetical protein KJ622_17800 [Alphaproteobacteria bacterium]|nr:hypothetical protein [Alphaproteobacteria bacterium]